LQGALSEEHSDKDLPTIKGMGWPDYYLFAILLAKNAE
jgi:hypothetical protein